MDQGAPGDVRGTRTSRLLSPKTPELARWFAEHKERWEGLKDTVRPEAWSRSTRSQLPKKNFQFDSSRA